MMAHYLSIKENEIQYIFYSIETFCVRSQKNLQLIESLLYKMINRQICRDS